MKRRQLLLLLATTTGTPGLLRAQPKQPVLIGLLNAASRESQGYRHAAFREALGAYGWKQGENFIVEERWADGRYEKLQSLAEELAAKKPALIIASPSQAVAVMAKVAPTTPIVIAGGDPLAAGLVPNLARPGGMITGVTNIVTEVNTKHMELLLAAVPTVRRIGFLTDPNNPSYAPMLESARRAVVQHQIEGRFADAPSATEIEPAIKRLAKEGAQALILQSGPLFSSERQRIAKLAAGQRWPWVTGTSEDAEAGALFSYGVDRTALFRRAAYYADRILKGAKAGDLPIEQPTKFELVVNLKTAKTLGLTLPQPFLMRADRVIE